MLTSSLLVLLGVSGIIASPLTNIATVTSATTTTVTSTTYTGSASTSYLFLPGSPPAKRDVEGQARCYADNCLRALRATKILTAAQAFCSSYTTKTDSGAPFPTYIPSDCNASRVSSACSCLPKPSTTSIPPTTLTIQTTITTTETVTLPISATTKTVYPCASPVNYQGPTYGDASGSANLGLSNSLYYRNTPEGASAQACCNLCFFGIPNCIQAYWYDYEGCVTSQATDLSSGTGQDVSGTCTAGTFAGLTYGPDTKPAFRSTGNIAGPCGMSYTNF